MTGAVTFDDYAEKILLPYIQSQGSRRIDIVWDPMPLIASKKRPVKREEKVCYVKSLVVARSLRNGCNSFVTR